MYELNVAVMGIWMNTHGMLSALPEWQPWAGEI